MRETYGFYSEKGIIKYLVQHAISVLLVLIIIYVAAFYWESLIKENVRIACAGIITLFWLRIIVQPIRLKLKTYLISMPMLLVIIQVYLLNF